MLLSINIEGYKSLRKLELDLSNKITIISGANGTGKTSIYRSLELVSHIAKGNLSSFIASEGGVQSLKWSGNKSMQSNRIAISLQTQSLNYRIEIGYPIPSESWFDYDPNIRREIIWIGDTQRPSNTIVLREGGAVTYIGKDNRKSTLKDRIHHTDSILDVLSGFQDIPEIQDINLLINQWKFYDEIPTNKNHDVLQPKIGTYSPILHSDCGNFASAVRTIFEIGDWQGFSTAINKAFDGCALEIDNSGGIFELQMHQPDIWRPLKLKELSSGTIRFIALLTALYSPRPSPLLIFNEPELGINHNLFEVLSEAIGYASESSQIVIITHSEALSCFLKEKCDNFSYHLKKIEGETLLS